MKLIQTFDDILRFIDFYEDKYDVSRIEDYTDDLNIKIMSLILFAKKQRLVTEYIHNLKHQHTTYYFTD
jgi:hypothetical protein